MCRNLEFICLVKNDVNSHTSIDKSLKSNVDIKEYLFGFKEKYFILKVYEKSYKLFL
jgi:hypothetical protein